ncbi:flagellar export protein FliJ [Frateuria soli]|uniref:flagellar export protein FliJ n=1 Tax=Frateuria soli TaxID=1542730 RepID=UPI001E532B65|nr:flagellar export protein FliJ [Frateuria soli]UGB38784.1 flagellar export protein FliJ [Frateuria soli]
MSKRADRLQPAADQARERSEDAVLKLAEQQQRMAKAERQLMELRGYRQEYANPAGVGGLTATALMNRQQFVARIDRAIEQQAAEIERLRRLLDQARGHWRDAHAREAALDNVIDRYREQDRKAEERRDQNDIDERMQYRRPSR